MARFPGKEAVHRAVGSLAAPRARCLFVLSTGRVGTLTLSRVLGLAHKVWATHEPWPRHLTETRNAFRDPFDESQWARRAELFCRYRFWQLLWSSLPGRTYAECSNRLTFFAPALADRLPRARFLFLFRHPAPVVRSLMRRKVYVGHPWDRYRIAPNADDPWFEAWDGWGPFERCCWYWHAINRLSLEVVSTLVPERVFRLPSEELFQPHGESVQRLLDWLGVPRLPAPALAHELGRRYNRQQKGQFPPIDSWKAPQRDALRRICGPTAAALGYGSDPDDGTTRGPSSSR